MLGARIANVLVATAGCLALVSPARAQVYAGADHDLAASAELNAGVDTNPQLSQDPNARATTTAGGTGPGSSGVAGALLNAYGTWGNKTWLGAALGSDARLYATGDARHDGALSLLGGAALDATGRSRLTLAILGGRYDATFGVDNAWYGSAVPALRLSLGAPWSIGIEGHTGVRRYQGGAQINLDYGSAFDVTWIRGPWYVSMGADVDRRQSSDDSATRTQLTPFATLQARTSRVALGLYLATYVRWFDQGDQNGSELTAEVRGRYRIAGNTWLTSRAALGHADGQTNALRYTRFVFLLGAALAWDSATQRATSQSVDRHAQGPAEVFGSQVRFRVCGIEAREAAVIGTFNAWSDTSGRMQRRGDCFEATLQVDPGHHRYQWLIDGVPQRPDGAPAYVTDDYGSDNAVLIVPN